MSIRSGCLLVVLASPFLLLRAEAANADALRDLQADAISQKRCEALHWGPDPKLYSSWTDHSNRLIPVYTYGTKGGEEGVDLGCYTGDKSCYRDRGRLERLYRADMEDSVSADAEYMDQTNVFDLQRAGLDAGRKHIFLVVFDGMDWQTTWAAAIYNLKRVAYQEGRGTGTHFQDYQADGTSQFGWMVTSPYRDGTQIDVNTQQVKNPTGGLGGGYDCRIAGNCPWSVLPTTTEYLLSRTKDVLVRRAYTDSAASATSLCCGIKTYNAAIGVTSEGRPQPSIAHLAQAEGYKVGAVTSVPISHATPGACYAHNVDRSDYQDISRDMLGLPSVGHLDAPLPGLDVVIGGGYGVESQSDSAQGENFVPGNKYLPNSDLKKLNIENGGNYVVSQRTAGVAGGEALRKAGRRAAAERARLFGYYGIYGRPDKYDGNLPYATADGQYDPAPGVGGEEVSYSQEELKENPTLAEMAEAAIDVLSAGDSRFWLMVEAGDVDWANHMNNIDASIGAVNSGDKAVRVITDWVERHSNWDESLLIVTADHGHYLVIDNPELLARRSASDQRRAKAAGLSKPPAR